MVVKSGKFGKFLACPNYPDCRTTLSVSDENEQDFVGKCPDCGNPMTARKSKKGKTYYSCSGYPACKFMSWDIPTGDKCPKCGGALVKTAKGNIKCDNKDCSYKEKTETKGKNSAPVFEEDFSAPPLMDEPLYFTDGYNGNE